MAVRVLPNETRNVHSTQYGMQEQKNCTTSIFPRQKHEISRSTGGGGGRDKGEFGYSKRHLSHQDFSLPQIIGITNYTFGCPTYQQECRVFTTYFHPPDTYEYLQIVFTKISKYSSEFRNQRVCFVSCARNIRHPLLIILLARMDRGE